MRTGRMRDKIRLERPSKTRNATTGAVIDSWVFVAIRSADILPINGSEQAFLSSEVSESNTNIVLRYDRALSDISAEWRAVDQRTGRIYDIEYHDPVTSGMRELKLQCVHRSK